MARKKIVFVIVEGPSDETALGALFSEIMDESNVYIHVVYGDITTQRYTTSSNILAKICNIVKTYAKENNFKKSDFKEIIHITDTDGVYVKDEHVQEDKNIASIEYRLDSIICNNRANIIRRNAQKRSILDKMHNCKYIWNSIPYSCYYMSCNLDHVLYDKMNCTNDEKDDNAHMFVKKYINNAVRFISYISESDFSVMNGYKESWEFIQQDRHSLERNTNLGIYFKTDCD